MAWYECDICSYGCSSEQQAEQHERSHPDHRVASVFDGLDDREQVG